MNPLGEAAISFSSLEGISKYYTLAQLSKKTGYHPVYLRRLILDGKVKGIKIQLGGGPGFWISTLEAIEFYKDQKRDNRGRPINNRNNK